MAVRASMKKLWDVAVVGEIFIDHVFSGFERWPQPGEEHFTDFYVREAGGGVAITACALARLGRHVSLFAVMGEEDVWLKDRLRSFSISLDGLRSVATSTAVSVSISTREDRSFLTWQGANRFLPEYLHEPETQDRLTQARHVHLAMPVSRELAQQLFPRLRAAGCTLSLDTGHQEQWLLDERNWLTCSEVDYFLPNEKECQIMTGAEQPEAVFKGLAAKGISSAIMKLGRAGAAAWADGQVCRAKALDVDAVDTTGAGDAFDAGLIDALLDGAQVSEMLQRACVCGSLSTRQAGALAALPGREELKESYDRIWQQ
jgi:sugar/nucleoside kinase (ribokinase family)